MPLCAYTRLHFCRQSYTVTYTDPHTHYSLSSHSILQCAPDHRQSRTRSPPTLMEFTAKCRRETKQIVSWPGCGMTGICEDSCEHRGKSKSSAWGLVKASWRRRHCSWYLKGEVECFQPQIIINKTTIILIYLALFYLICVNELIKLSSRALSSPISWEPLCPFSK